MAFWGLTLGVLGNRIIENHQLLAEEVEVENKEEVMALFGTMPNERNEFSNISIPGRFSSSTLGNNRIPPSWSSQQTSRLGTVGTALCEGGSWNWQRFAWMCFMVVVLVSIVAYQSHWDIITTIYYMIVTSCTIGYGDLVPSTQLERLAAVIYIPLVCLIMGHWLGYVANAIIERQSSKFRKKRLEHRELTQDDLDAMDVNGNGKVSWAEFLEFMLVAMEKVDYEMVDELQTCFRSLDVARTGELSRADLVEAARRKLRSASRKLELATYKRRVINLGKFAINEDEEDEVGTSPLRRLSYMTGGSPRSIKNKHLQSFLSTRPSRSAKKPQHSWHMSYGSVRNINFSPSVDLGLGASTERFGPPNVTLAKKTTWEPPRSLESSLTKSYLSGTSRRPLEDDQHRCMRRQEAATKDTKEDVLLDERTHLTATTGTSERKIINGKHAVATDASEQRHSLRLAAHESSSSAVSVPAPSTDSISQFENRHHDRQTVSLSAPQAMQQLTTASKAVTGMTTNGIRQASGSIAEWTNSALKRNNEDTLPQHDFQRRQTQWSDPVVSKETAPLDTSLELPDV